MSVRFPKNKKTNITPRKSDVGILKSVLERVFVNIKIKLRYVRYLLPAKVTVDFSKVERQIAIGFMVQEQNYNNTRIFS